MDLQALANERATLRATLAAQEDMQRDLAAKADASRTRLVEVEARINVLLTAAPLPELPPADALPTAAL